MIRLGIQDEPVEVFQVVVAGDEFLFEIGVIGEVAGEEIRVEGHLGVGEQDGELRPGQSLALAGALVERHVVRQLLDGGDAGSVPSRLWNPWGDRSSGLPSGFLAARGAALRAASQDGQLDEAPLTFEELNKVKNSFQFTLLNMLHARVAYPAGESAPTTEAKA